MKSVLLYKIEKIELSTGEVLEVEELLYHKRQAESFIRNCVTGYSKKHRTEISYRAVPVVRYYPERGHVTLIADSKAGRKDLLCASVMVRV